LKSCKRGDWDAETSVHGGRGVGPASISWAAGVSGNYIEARTADVFTGPCFANGEVEINGKEAVFGWKIGTGAWQGVNLEALVVGVIRSEHTLGKRL